MSEFFCSPSPQVWSIFTRPHYWEVRRRRRHDGTLLPGWKVWDGSTRSIRLFKTWAGAMEHADKLSRTITVTLPRIEDRHAVTPYPETYPLMVEARSYGAAIFTKQFYKEILLTRRELKPLALALLAHHYKREGA